MMVVVETVYSGDIDTWCHRQQAGRTAMIRYSMWEMMRMRDVDVDENEDVYVVRDASVPRAKERLGGIIE